MVQRLRQAQLPFRGQITRIREMDRITMAIIASIVALVGTIIFPKIIPAAKHGIQCYDLPSPIGGNNRSLLAQSGQDQQSLELQIGLDSTTIGLNSNLKINATFVNHDIGPAILYLDRQRPLITADNYAIGLRVEITRMDGSYLINQTVNSAPWTTGPGYARINTWVDPGSLHLLGSRSRCTIGFSYFLNQAGAMVPGDYRIRAYYYNNNGGSVRPFNPDEPTVTATAAYSDQGVWTGTVSSSEVRFTVSGP